MKGIIAILIWAWVWWGTAYSPIKKLLEEEDGLLQANKAKWDKIKRDNPDRVVTPEEEMATIVDTLDYHRNKRINKTLFERKSSNYQRHKDLYTRPLDY